METERGIVFGDVNRTATADYDARSLSATAEAIYRMPAGGLTWGPLAKVQAVWASHDAARETGAGALDLSLDSESFSQLTTGLGGAVEGRWAAGQAQLTAQVRASWEHVFGDTMHSQGLMLAGSPIPFTVRSTTSDRNRLAVGAALGAQLSPSLSLTARYGGRFSGSGLSHAGHLSGSIRF